MSILDKALAACTGARQADYGTPAENHARTAALWGAWDKVRPPGPETPVDVCVRNILQKLARGANSWTEDTAVDIAGYAWNLWECVEATRPERILAAEFAKQPGLSALTPAAEALVASTIHGCDDCGATSDSHAIAWMGDGFLCKHCDDARTAKAASAP